MKFLYPRLDWARLEAALAEDPQSIHKTFAGRPFRYWSSVFAQDPLPGFLSLDIPILVGIGVDRSAIALGLGHDSPETTQMYLHADR